MKVSNEKSKNVDVTLIEISKYDPELFSYLKYFPT